MKFVTVSALLVMLTLAVFPGQNRNPANMLSIELRSVTERRSYGLKDSVILDIEIINSGQEPVGVFGKLGIGYQGGVILHALDGARVEVQPQILPHDFLDVRAIQNPKNYFELQPGHFFGTRQTFAIRELVSKPGHYKLLAEYHCPVDANVGKVANFWNIERKSVVSNEIDFNVE